MNNPLISIIMPAYNAEKYIAESIQSVLDQSYSNWELVIVNDGSTDNTANVIKDYCRDARIKYFYQQNGKQGKARNFAIKESNGEYLAFLDADDIWMPEKLSIQLNEIGENGVDLVFSDSYIFENLATFDRSVRINTIHGRISREEGLILLLEGNKIPNLTVLVKKQKVIDVGCLTEKPEIQNAEDYHLWLKLLINGNSFYGSNLVLAAYRMHSKASTFDDKNAGAEALEAVLEIMNQFPAMASFIIRIFFKKYLVEIELLRSRIAAFQQTRTSRLFVKLKNLKAYFRLISKKDLAKLKN